jgi:hypothetical protein
MQRLGLLLQPRAVVLRLLVLQAVLLQRHSPVY